ncbi:futalosine hydrolase [Desulfovibrio ferrophilus]|uniref:Futalosine hydrolase n=1 Tax=Desulfovibrio ferrophilus TaxID=241368 RepID=A0A2Z6B2F1_9BACT|nr:futalosine hydrolase [Desulfovibrio ferrophilus]BBD09684.1 purine/other phosphorylase family 1 [Desulfovibrio ferrophilus]
MLALFFATAKEFCAALPGFEAPAQGHWRQTIIAGKSVLVAVTGVGPVNAALCLGRMLGVERPTGILNLGVAGSFDLALHPLGSMLIANTETWPEYGLRTEQGIDPKGIGFPLASTPQGPIHDCIPLTPTNAAQAMGLHLPSDWPLGASLTVSAATGTENHARNLQQRYQPAMENMEGFALALGCLHADLPFLEARSISNVVGSRDKDHWDLAGALATLATAISELFEA